MIFQILFVLTSIYLWAIVFHELGHIFFFATVLKKYPDINITTRPLSLRLGYPLDYRFMNKKQIVQVNLFGIIYGIIPLTFVVFFFRQPYADLVFIPMIVIYLIGCKGDIGRIIKAVKEK